jgi:hypothetical protein
VTLAAGLWAQDKPKPDFSGNWAIDLQATARANGKAAPSGQTLNLMIATGGARMVPETFTLEQTERSLTIKQPKRADIVYVLDNKPHKNEVASRGGKMEIVVRTRWDGNKIVMTNTQRTINTGELREVEYKEVRSLDKEGRLQFELDVSSGQGSYKAVYVKQP